MLFYRVVRLYSCHCAAAVCGALHEGKNTSPALIIAAAANDPNQYPDEPGGVWHISDGSAGRGPQNTVVLVLVNGKTVIFRAVGAEHGYDRPFNLIDQWNFPAP